MLIYLVMLLICVAIFWLVGHFVVKHRFAALKSDLPKTYQSAIAAPTEDDETPRLMLLCIDLMRKTHCADPFEALSTHEQTMALHAHAVEALPEWMSKYAALGLSRSNRALIAKMHHVKASRPTKKPTVHYGAIKRQQQLRQASKP